MRILAGMAIVAALCFLTACRGAGPGMISAGKHPRIVLNASTPRPTIDVVDVPPDQLALIAGANSREAWTTILRVTSRLDQPPALGQYSIEGNAVRFTPMFPLERGRQYHVTFTAPGADPVTASVGLPPPDTTPITTAEVFPSAEVVPSNLQRIHIRFSGPMGPRGALDFVHLIDEAGQEVKDPFMALDAESWNEDRTQYSIDLDPDRHTLIEGTRFRLVVDRAWTDAKGLQLTQTIDRTFSVGPPAVQPLDPKTWKIDSPSADSSQLVITFPQPLDYESLQSAITVVSPAGKPVNGDVVVSNHELTWSFIPEESWVPGTYTIAVEGLDDLAGNGLGKSDSEKILLPFVVH